MSLNLPDRASFEYLKKLAKDSLASLRATDPGAKLADAQLAIARQYGFPSWRALKAEMDRRRAPNVAEFVRACTAGDTQALGELLTTDPALARARVAGGSTGLHLAAGRPDVLRLLVEHGADPNARDVGDNATALHFAAANGQLESVRVLLDAGADVHGTGDLHNGDVIGWAARKGNEAVVDLLLERGARHHVFSAMALGDLDLVRRVIEENPEALSRRRSRFENEHTPLHAAFAPPDGLGYLTDEPNYALLQLLIESGADLEARDNKGRTPLGLAMLRGDERAMRLLRAAGAKEPEASASEGADFRTKMAAASASVRKTTSMFSVRDMRATVRWYASLGFAVEDAYEDGGELTFARLTFGNGEFAVTPGREPGARGVTLWFFTDRIQDLYELLKARQLRVARAAASGPSDEPEVRFAQDLHEPFYGGRQFSVSDLNGLELVFWQPDWLAPREGSTARG